VGEVNTFIVVTSAGSMSECSTSFIFFAGEAGWGDDTVFVQLHLRKVESARWFHALVVLNSIIM
jgi:hypothetical protein